MSPRIIGAAACAAAQATPVAPAPHPAGAARAASVTPAAARRLQVDEHGAGQRLDNYLLRALKGVPKSHVYRVIRSGEVRVPPLRLPERAAAPPVPAREFPVLYEDDALLAVDKPAGVAAHGGSGVAFGVIEQLRRARPQARFLELVHRLDKDTSGVLLLAKKRSALTALQQRLRERGVDKRYLALVTGAWPARLKVIDQPLHKTHDAAGARQVRVVAPGHAQARRAITLVRRIEPRGGFTLLELVLQTGRTHQLRVHLAHCGHPIAGDPKYGDFALNRALVRGDAVPGQRFERMFLHAWQLAFAHPASGEPVLLQAPLPAACAALLQAL